MNFYIYLSSAFAGGFIIAWLIRTLRIAKLKKEHNSIMGLLESERLMKETAQKENTFLLRSSDSALTTVQEKLKKAEAIIHNMDTDILLLQKSNEETESLLAKGEPALYEMKMKLIEANNAIARYKSREVTSV